MQISQLRTLVAIEASGSFSAAAARVNLSHSAVSVQMKQLEQDLGAEIFVKGRRPATLTPVGAQLAARARQLVAEFDALATLGRGDNTRGEITIGFVPTTLTALLPVVLAGLRDRFAELQVSVRSGLSTDLARAVERGDMDFAFLTAPLAPSRDLVLSPVADEPLMVISPPDAASGEKAGDGDLAAVFAARPYIAFSRESWLGGQIARALETLGISAAPAVELDSIDAIEMLVAEGFGNSVVPRRLLARPLGDRVRSRALPGGEARHLTLASHVSAPRETLRREILALIAARAAP